MLLVADPGRGYRAVQAEIDAAIARVLRSGWFVLGPEVASFEREFAAYLGCRHAIGVSSGTDALRVALLACGVGPGDEVLTVANAGDPTTMAVWSVGAIPRLVDVDPVTSTLDPCKVERAIGPRTKAILPIHLYGRPAHMEALAAIARGASLRLIEDACQAHGAQYQGRRVGTIGDIGCFSFYPTKNLGALGDGGMVVSDDDHLAEQARLIREYGWKPRNRAVIKGVNSRLDELQAAVLRVKLGRLDDGNARRREIASRYRSGLAGLTEAHDLVLPTDATDSLHVYHLFVVRTRQRDALRDRLAARGVGAGIHYPCPTHLQPAFEGQWERRPSLPVTERLAGEVLSLPIFPEMTDDEVEQVIEAMLAAHRDLEA